MDVVIRAAPGTVASVANIGVFDGHPVLIAFHVNSAHFAQGHWKENVVKRLIKI
jgi:hypothetical protein